MADAKLAGYIWSFELNAFYAAELTVRGGYIEKICELSSAPDIFILPGLVDSHGHIESSLMVPREAARAMTIHGTVAFVADPHEIANVLGISGVKWMIDNGGDVPFHFAWGAPSTVPESDFVTAGARMSPEDVESLLSKPEVTHLAELMNFPGVIAGGTTFLQMIDSAKKHKKPIDGHAPLLRGEGLKTYVGRGIQTDHEASSLEEALEKLEQGMMIAVREGSAAKNLDALYSLVDSHTDKVMFCADDIHPDLLKHGHINTHVKKCLKAGIPLAKILRASSFNPVQHYKLNVGLLKEGDSADFLIVEDPTGQFNIRETFIRGECVMRDGHPLIPSQSVNPQNQFEALPLSLEQIKVSAKSRNIRVIEIVPGQLITNELICEAKEQDGYLMADASRDLLKIVVLNRYGRTAPSVGFVKGFGISGGGIASSVAHDSHNIIAVGDTDGAIIAAMNSVIESRGGLSLHSQDDSLLLPLPVAGLMSDLEYDIVTERYEALDSAVRHKLCSKLPAPFMTLSFLALSVIPSLKITDRGLVIFKNGALSYTSVFS